MMLDFYKLIHLLLPHALRRSSILALLRVLIASQLQPLFAKYHIFRSKTKFEASMTPQACSLQHGIERMFDVNCSITELDGKPYDFLVSIDRSTDLNAIQALIDKHKLVGKSFVFKLGDVSFSATWFNWVDEDIVESYSATWADYVDEINRSLNIIVYAYKNAGGYVVAVDAEKAVTSTLFVTGLLTMRNSLGQQVDFGSFNIQLIAGSNIANVFVSYAPTVSSISVDYVQSDIISDDDYDYILHRNLI